MKKLTDFKKNCLKNEMNRETIWEKELNDLRMEFSKKNAIFYRQYMFSEEMFKHLSITYEDFFNEIFYRLYIYKIKKWTFNYKYRWNQISQICSIVKKSMLNTKTAKAELNIFNKFKEEFASIQKE